MSLPLDPTALDLWLTRLLTGLTGNRLLDLSIQSGERHSVLGGLWFALAVFLLWVEATKKADAAVRRRILTIVLGTLLAAGVSDLLTKLFQWGPPRNHAALAQLYPRYWDPIENPNSFPSQSTTIFAAVAAGVYSLRKRAGVLLWVAVALAGALPRMYIGGHWLSDALVGAALGIGGYLLARWLEPRLAPATARVEGARWGAAALNVVVFLFVWQVTVGFREAVWIKRAIPYFIR